MKTRIAIAVLLAGTTGLAVAQNMKPGLWEITNRMQTGSGQMENQMAQMQQQMASMPPEQRKMVEEMMAKQGVQMARPGQGGGMAARVCMTKEMVERQEVPTQRGDCKTTSQERSGNTMRIAFTCANPPSKGQGQVTFNNPESYSMKMNMEVMEAGRNEKVNMDASGKWLSADCGNLKPLSAPAKK